jgi:hypothetical protein
MALSDQKIADIKEAFALFDQVDHRWGLRSRANTHVAARAAGGAPAAAHVLLFKSKRRRISRAHSPCVTTLVLLPSLRPMLQRAALCSCTPNH